MSQQHANAVIEESLEQASGVLATPDLPKGFGSGALIERSQRKETWRRFKRYKPALFGLAFIVLLVICAIFAAWIAPYDPNEVNSKLRGAGPSAQHWLGNDD